MVEAQIDHRHEAGHIVLSPNLSARWKTNVYFLYAAIFAALIIGGGFAYVGLWMILPFTGLEILALVLLIYRVAHKCHHIEVIHISRDRLRVEHGYRNPKSSWESDLFWTRLIVGQQTHPIQPLRLYLRGREGKIEIGTFLNDEDKQILIRELRPYISLA